jgi:hypothetical protein
MSASGLYQDGLLSGLASSGFYLSTLVDGLTSSGLYQDSLLLGLASSGLYQNGLLTGLASSGMYQDALLLGLASSGLYQDSLLLGLASSGLAQDSQITNLQNMVTGVTSSGTPLSIVQQVIIPALGTRYRFNVNPTGSSEIYDLGDIQDELPSTRHRVGDCEDSIAGLTSDDGSTAKSKSLFGAAIGIGVGSAVLGAGLALAVGSSSAGRASALRLPLGRP